MKFGWFPLCLFCLILAGCNHDKSLTGNDFIPAPSHLTATPISASQIELSWQDNSDDETGYKVEGRLATVVDFTAELGPNATRFRDVFLLPDTEYAYRVLAVKGAVTSKSSNLVFARTFKNRGAWKELQSGTDEHLRAVSLPEARIGFVVGNGGAILKTTDAGENWQAQGSGTANPFRGVFFISAQIGTAVGGGLPDGVTEARRTLNGGLSWAAQQVPAPEARLRAVHFSGENAGTVVGDQGIIMRTTNGGRNWDRQSAPINSDLFGLCFSSADNGIVVGASGVILATTNGGRSWEARASGVSADLYEVDWSVAGEGLAVGAGGMILRTADAGLNWQRRQSGATLDLFAVTFATTQIAFAVGAEGVVLKTRDGGLSWQTLASGTLNTLFDVAFFDSDFGLAVGEFGTVLRTTSGGE